MRPAHCAREVVTPTYAPERYRHRFNEARALCAGSYDAEWRGKVAAGGFNEARALCAGSLRD